MSSVARKSGNRTEALRQRIHADHLVVSRRAPAQSIGWDEDTHHDPNAVFVPVFDVEAFLDKMDRCIEEAKLNKLEHQFLDGGVLIRFRCKRDADVFRQVIAG